MNDPTDQTASPVLDFSVVTREIRSIIVRRRELMVFLGSLFVALSLFLDNLLHGSLPPALASIGQQAFFNYSIMLLVPSLLIALRIMRLHNGMTINGVFYSQILSKHGDAFADPLRASKLNWTGISTNLFLLTVLNVVLAAVLFTLTFQSGWIIAILIGIGFGIALLTIFLYNHHRAKHFALKHIKQATIEPINSEAVEDHNAQSLQDANQDMIGITAFAGLILFSVLESLSGLGDVTYNGDIAVSDVINFGPLIYINLALVTTILGALMYRRLAVAAGELSLKLDPTDDPFQPLNLTDTFFGYLMICALFGISLHLLIFMLNSANWWIEILANILMISLYPLRMWLTRMRFQQKANQ
ncbi:hypothetical protein TI05_00765 [Achromatium sp. WMS3]|nr:hypothetical protein TI05_00765 [Achromatium sp. WMS3]